MSDKFRRQLRQEVEQWHSEGLIDQTVYEQLGDRYKFKDLEYNASNRFILILLGLGSVLLGLGIITFVAANWQVWARELKITILLSGFIGINTAGFYLWRRSNQQWKRSLGQALLLLGALVLGANMALMSQLFHQSGQVYQLYLVWGLGVLAMAYSLRLTMLGVMSSLLVWLGYLRYLWEPEVVAFGRLSWLQLFVQHLPVLVALLFIPLAYWCKSRWIFRLSAIAIIFSLEANILRFNLLVSSPWMGAIACALPPALLWAYNDSLLRRHPLPVEVFSGIARSLAITFLSLLFYVLSFYGLWNTSLVASPENVLPLYSPPLLDLLLLGILALWQWLRLLRRWNLNNYLVAGMILISAVVPVWHLGGTPQPAYATLIFNLLLFLLSIGLIREGIGQGKRQLFWGGMVLFTVSIFSRMLEYNTDLLFKSFVLFLCGFGLMGGGLWFERRLRTKIVKVRATD
ncbi:MAG: DUF2157 domain-containing protein [Coleofasciculaceae cyanobacterium]